MRRILIFFSLALLVAAGAPAVAQMLPPEVPPIYEGPQWFPEPPEMIFDLVIAHPGESSDLAPPDELLPQGTQPGAGGPGRKGSTQSPSAVSVNAASGPAGGSILAGSTLGSSFNPVAELDGRVREARRALDS